MYFKKPKELQKASKKFLNKMIFLFALFLLPVLSLYALQRYDIITVPPFLFVLVETLVKFFIVYLIAFLFLRITIKPIMDYFKSEMEAEQRLLTAKVYSYIIYLMATIFVFWSLGVNAQNLTILLGLATTGIAFALRDVLMSYLAWFVLLMKKPFRIGDYIKIGEDKGRVMHIGTFFVLLDDNPDNKEDYVRVPNKTFLEKSVSNLGKDKIVLNMKIPITKVSKTIYSKIKKIKKKVASVSLKESQVWLEPTEDKWYVRIEFTTTFDEKSSAKDDVMKEVISILGKSVKS